MCCQFVIPGFQVPAGVDVPGGTHVGVQGYLHVSAELQETVGEAADELQLVVAGAEY